MAARPKSWEIGDDTQLQRTLYHAPADDPTVTDFDQPREDRDSLELHNRETHGCRTRSGPSDREAPLDRFTIHVHDSQYHAQTDQAPASDQTRASLEPAGAALELREGMNGYHSGLESFPMSHERDAYERYMSLADDDQVDGGRDYVTTTDQMQAPQGTVPALPGLKPANGMPRMCDSLDGNADEIATLDELIDDLESVKDVLEPQEVAGKVEVQSISEELLQTSELSGLAEADVISRRRAYGFNQLKEERHNYFKKLLGFFVGPIQFVMQVIFTCNA